MKWIKYDNIYRLAGLLCFLVLWETAGRLVFTSGMIPSFSETFVQMLLRIKDGTFIHHGKATLTRTYLSFIVASILGVSSGLLIGWNRKARLFFDFLIDFLRNVSSITLIPITILIVGIGFAQKAVVIAYASYFPIVLNTINGVASADKSKIEAAQTMGASDWQIMKDVLVYSALPSIVTGLRLAIGVSFVVVIAAELVGSTSGLGYYLHEASRTYQITDMFAAALFVSILGYLSSKAVILAGDRIIKWRDLR